MANIADLLRSSDPYERQEGLTMLVDSGNPKTLAVLKKFHKDDPDPDVRALAARYGKELQSGGSTPTPSKPKRKPKRKRSDVDPKEALESAMHYLIQNDYPTAWQFARDAFEADPSLRNDEYAVGLAADITGTSRENAVATLLSAPSNDGDDYYEEDLGYSSSFVDSERVGWGRALLSVGAYGLISAIIATVAIFLLADTFIELMRSIIENDPTMSSSEIREFNQFLDNSGTFVIGFGVANFFSTLIGNMIGMLIGLGIIHLVATNLLSGTGYYTNLLYNTRIPYIVAAVVSGLMGVYATYLIFAAFPTDPATLEIIMTSDNPEVALEPIMRSLGAAISLIGVSALVNFAILGWVSVVIGKTYDFGAGKGCLAIIISAVLPVIAWCGCNIAISVFAGGLAQ